MVGYRKPEMGICHDRANGRHTQIALNAEFRFRRIPMELQTHGARKHTTSKLLRSSAGLMAEIAAAKLPLAQIALNACFSSQASFTRAFRRATGLTPGK